VLEYLDPLTYFEVRELFDLDRALQVGMLAGIYLGDSEAVDVLETYADVYLRGGDPRRGRGQEPGRLRPVFGHGGHPQWAVVELFEDQLRDRDPEGNHPKIRPGARGHASGFPHPSVSTTAKDLAPHLAERQVPLVRYGVRNALLGLHRRQLSQDQTGAAFEQWFTLQIIYSNRALRKGWALSAYRTEGGAEWTW